MEYLIPILLLLILLINIYLLLKNNNNPESNSYKNISDHILKFQVALDKNEKIIYDQLERNRNELSKTSK